MRPTFTELQWLIVVLPLWSCFRHVYARVRLVTTVGSLSRIEQHITVFLHRPFDHLQKTYVTLAQSSTVASVRIFNKQLIVLILIDIYWFNTCNKAPWDCFIFVRPTSLG